MNDEPPTPQGSAALLTAFSTAHHDIWWAKSHAWTVSNWAIAGIVGVASLTQVKRPDGSPALNPWLIVIGTNCLALLASAYIAQMQADMVVARLKAATISARHPELKAVLQQIDSGLPASLTRGAWFMRALTLLISVADGLASLVTVWQLPVSLLLGCMQTAIGWILIAYLPCRRLWLANGAHSHAAQPPHGAATAQPNG